MAVCPSCGANADPGARFCTTCGKELASPASVVSTAATAVQPALQPVQPAWTSDSDQVQALEEKRSGARLLLILGIALFVCLAAVYFFVNGTVSFFSPKAKTASTATTGNSLIGAYPNAHPLGFAGEPGVKVLDAFSTADTPAQVIGFYQVRFPVCETRVSDASGTLKATMGNGTDVVVQADVQRPGETHVIITSR